MSAESNNTPKNEFAMPLKGYRLLDYKLDPTVVGLALETDQGPHLFVLTREILEVLSQAFAQKASEMPVQPKA